MKRLNGTRAIAFIALMAALDLISILIDRFVLGLGLIALLIVPLTSSLVAILCPIKYSFIYIIATSLMSFISPEMALFTIMPALISGVVSGLLIKKYIQGYLVIFINSLVLSSLQILSTYLIKIIYNIDLITMFGNILKLETLMPSIYLMFLFIISLIEASLSYMIAYSELSKLGIQFNENKNQFILILILNIVFIIISIGLNFVYRPSAYLLISFTYYFGVVLGVYLFSYIKRKEILIIQIPLYVISLILVFILFSFTSRNYSYLLLLIIPGSELISSLYIIIKEKLINKNKISFNLFN